MLICLKALFICYFVAEIISFSYLCRKIRGMSVSFVIIFAILVVSVTLIGAFLSLRRQEKVILHELMKISTHLMELEIHMAALQSNHNLNNHAEQSHNPVGATDQHEHVDLSSMDDAALFDHLSKVIKDEQMFRWPVFNRAAVIEHFTLSAARVGSAFAKGGGMGLPEFVRNCRLDFACRLMVERPELSFVEVGESSGYQRTTTFYHDFKARFGMTPAEYRAKELEKTAI